MLNDDFTLYLPNGKNNQRYAVYTRNIDYIFQYKKDWCKVVLKSGAVLKVKSTIDAIDRLHDKLLAGIKQPRA